ncbi:hypothetical protein CYMTET_12713 [Cymbomonas tetramitiformis]|uniref:Uncharacterized protein n=1 Tax=Cymbomonas tetramitiformis TaxID=36881 RepID=A0AAE0GJX4_9CHLO|nr:hypothetical protein CYMTET_12713 [Cymbomonas tetramitiformis]
MEPPLPPLRGGPDSAPLGVGGSVVVTALVVTDKDIQPTEEERLLSEEFVFCDAVASGEGANDDADNDEDAD